MREARMIKPKYNWDFNTPENEISAENAKKLKLTPIVKQILESKKPLFYIFDSRGSVFGNS